MDGAGLEMDREEMIYCIDRVEVTRYQGPKEGFRNLNRTPLTSATSRCLLMLDSGQNCALRDRANGQDP